MRVDRLEPLLDLSLGDGNGSRVGAYDFPPVQSLLLDDQSGFHTILWAYDTASTRYLRNVLREGYPLHDMLYTL